MPTIEASFLADICANPTDDVPRLIFADWLDEQGDPARAEFIRVQCEIADAPPTRWWSGLEVCRHNEKASACYRCREPRKRERELLEKHGGDFAGPVARLLGATKYRHDFGYEGMAARFAPHIRWKWRRGFIAEFAMPLVQFMEYGERLALLCPLEGVTLTDCRPLVHVNRWAWYCEVDRERQARSGYLPSSLFDLLPEGEYGDTTEGSGEYGFVTAQWQEYRSEALARAALSHAAVKWARQAAGQPELAMGGEA